MTDIQKQLAEALDRAQAFLDCIRESGYKARHGCIQTPNYMLIGDILKNAQAALAAHRQQEARNLLTDEEIRSERYRLGESFGFGAGVRFAERFYGIKGE